MVHFKLVSLVFQIIVFGLLAGEINCNLNWRQHDEVDEWTTNNRLNGELKSVTQDHNRRKRETKSVEVNIDGEKVVLNLNPVKYPVMHNNTPVWTVRTVNGRSYNYKKLDPKEARINEVFYEDRDHMATLLASERDGETFYEGVIGWGGKAKAVKISEKSMEFSINKSTENSKTSKVLYPKILVVADQTIFFSQGRNVQETIKYVATFWNAVNSMYSDFDEPEVRILVTGLIIAEDETALDFVYQSTNDGFKDIVKNTGQYFRLSFPLHVGFENYDGVIVMSNSEALNVQGLSYNGAICSLNTIHNAGYIHDGGNYQGISIGAHELGHMLSFKHDNNVTCNGVINQDVQTIMHNIAYPDKTKFIWSECSKRNLREFARDKKSACLEKSYRQRNHELIH